MSTVRYDDPCALEISSLKVVLAHNHKSGQFSMSSGTWSECKRLHTCNSCKCLIQFIIDFKSPLYGTVRLKRMFRLEGRHIGNFLVYFRIVLHGTTSERIESCINSEIHLREIGIMSYYVNLTNLRKIKTVCTFEY